MQMYQRFIPHNTTTTPDRHRQYVSKQQTYRPASSRLMTQILSVVGLMNVLFHCVDISYVDV